MASGEFKTIQLENDGPIWTLRVNRPEALNALNSEVLNEFSHAVRFISEMDFEHARGLIITGAGEKAFVAGADIKEMSSLNREGALSFARRGQTIFHELSLLKIPVIAAVNGFALGGGCELALACDFIFASDNAKFGLPEVTLGLIPGFGGTVRLARAVGIRKARELTFSGEMISAAQALDLGLANQVFPQNELISKAKEKLLVFSSRAPQAVALAKKSILQAWDLDIESAQKSEALLFAEVFDWQDTHEGMQAFLEKRKPQFQGK